MAQHPKRPPSKSRKPARANLPAKPKPRAAGLPARQVAFGLLERILGHKRSLDEALADEARAVAELEARDRGFALLLTRTVLRRMGQLDALIDRYLDKDPGGARGRALRTLLRIGLAQLVFLGTPPHAAVDGSVRLAAFRKLGAFRGLINAVLRRAAGEAGTLAQDQDAARLNCPAWLWRSWENAHGAPAARAIAESLLSEPPLDLTLKPELDATEWAERMDATWIAPSTLRLSHAGDVRALPGYDDGAWWVQDLAASMPVHLLGPVKGRRVLDLCAAPGGKTARLAALGAEVTAMDRSAARLTRLEENMTRLGLSATVVTADATTWTPPDGILFDAILIDAPCSGTGTIRRHPDLGRLKSSEDVTRLSALQDRLIDAGLTLLAPGGRLVFATCSLEPEEGEDRIRALLERNPDVKVVPPGPTGPPDNDCPSVFREGVTADGWVRLMPHYQAEAGGMDGFFAAAIERIT